MTDDALLEVNDHWYPFDVMHLSELKFVDGWYPVWQRYHAMRLNMRPATGDLIVCRTSDDCWYRHRDTGDSTDSMSDLWNWDTDWSRVERLPYWKLGVVLMMDEGVRVASTYGRIPDAEKLVELTSDGWGAHVADERLRLRSGSTPRPWRMHVAAIIRRKDTPCLAPSARPSARTGRN